MDKPTENFPSSLDIISQEKESLDVFHGSLNLMYVNNLIRQDKLSQASRYFSSDFFQPNIIESRLWFFTQIELYVGLKDFEGAKNFLLNRLKKFPKDMSLYKLLQYVLWVEYLDCKELWEISDGEEQVTVQNGNSLDALEESILKENFLTQDLEFSFWKMRDLNSSFKKNAGVDKYRELADLGILASDIHEMFTRAGFNSLEYLFLEEPKKAFESFHIVDKNFMAKFQRKSSLCSYIYMLKDSRESELKRSGLKTSKIAVVKKRKLSSFYAATLISSSNIQDCLSYISLNKGILGAYYIDACGFPIAIGENSSPQFLKSGLKFISQFQKNYESMYRENEELLSQSLHFSQHYFYQIFKLANNYLLICGESQRFDILKASFERCRMAIAKIQEQPNSGSRLGRIAKIETVRSLCLIRDLKNSEEIRWKGQEPEGLNVVELLEKLQNYAQTANFEKFQEFILGSKSVIIFGHRVRKKFLIVLADKNAEMGRIRWEMKKSLEIE